jgi:phosphatidylglycerol:prolipoprotein diacylglycerol transferase
MIPLVLPFPAIDPVAISLGPLSIRWYALAYIAGILIGWRYARALARRSPFSVVPEDFDDLVLWATLGIVIGGRIGYVLFYNSAYFLAHPLEIFAIWSGGMSFHGGAIGVAVATVLFAHTRGRPIHAVSDILGATAPIGLFLGRIANFINGELYGRPSDVPWAMVFPNGGPEPRHPSQLYEAFLEGIVLFVVLYALVRWAGGLARPWFMTGAFLVGYGLLRIVGELFRQPDAQISYLVFGTTMGQLLSVPMVAVGLWLIVRSRRTA